jgi:hypothetical protein
LVIAEKAFSFPGSGLPAEPIAARAPGRRGGGHRRGHRLGGDGGEIFAFQHDPETIGNGEYTFFDNESDGPQSRVVTVKLNLRTKVATLVAAVTPLLPMMIFSIIRSHGRPLRRWSDVRR